MVARSSVKTKCRAIILVSTKVGWLQINEPHAPILFTNSISDKYLATNPIMHARMKHIKIMSFISFVKGKLDVKFTPSKEHVVDIFTKSLGESRFLPLKIKLIFLPSSCLKRGIRLYVLS